MTPSSAKPLNKVTYAAVASALTVIILSLLRTYVWTDMPADLEGPLNTLVLAGVVAGISGFTGYMTRLAPGEVTVKDARRIAEDGKV